MGLDYSLPTILKAKRRDEVTGLWVVGDATRLPVRSGVFDGVLCFGVTQALSDSDGVVLELAAASRPGGQIWLDALNAWCLPHVIELLMRKVRGRPVHVRYESPRILKRLMRDSGLRNIRLHWLPILPARLQGMQWLLETPFTIWLLHTIPILGAVLSHSFVLSATKSELSDDQVA